MMVSKQKAFKASSMSAGIVGIVYLVTYFLELNACMTGIVLVLAIFGIAYYGMRS